MKPTRLVFILLAISCISYSSYGQLYLDNGILFNEHRTNSDLGLDVKAKTSWQPRIGWMFRIAKSNSNIKLGIELEYFTRSFEREFESVSNDIYFTGLSTNLIGAYTVADRFHVNTGVKFAFYSSRFDLDGESKKVADVFNSFDWGILIGGGYSPLKFMTIGARVNFWFLPMIEYRTVGDYGEFSDLKKDVYTTSFECFLRFSILNDKE